jgi:hypothetical protein
MQLLERLMDVIDRRNFGMLPAPIYPEPIKTEIQSQIAAPSVAMTK